MSLAPNQKDPKKSSVPLPLPFGSLGMKKPTQTKERKSFEEVIKVKRPKLSHNHNMPMKVHPEPKRHFHPPPPSKSTNMSRNSDIEELEKYLARRNEPKPKCEFTQLFQVKCFVRNRVFDAAYASHENARNVAAMQALEYLFGSEIN